MGQILEQMKMHVVGIKILDIHSVTVFFLKGICFILLYSQLRVLSEHYYE